MKDNKHYWLKSGSYTLILNVCQLVLGFGGFYLLVRILDKNSFGIWTLFTATTTIFEMARGGLIQFAMIKFLSECEEDEKPKIISAAFILSGILLIACIILNISLAGFLSRLWHYPALFQMFILYILVYILQGFLSQFQWIEQSNFRFQGVLVTTLIKLGGFFIYILVCFLLHRQPSLLNLIFVQAFSTGIAAVVEYFFVKNFLVISYQIHFDWIKKLFNYGKFVFGTSVSGIFSGAINQMMLGTMISPDAAGTYNVAIRIINLTEVPINALGSVLFPQSAKRFALQGEQAGKYLFEKSVGTILAVLIPIVLFVFFFHDLTVKLIAGADYSYSARMVQVVILTCLLSPYDRFFGVILDSTGRAKLNFIIIFLVNILVLIPNYVAIREYGIMGVVYVTLIVDLIVFVIRQKILHKIMNVNILSPFKYAYHFYPDMYRHYFKPFIRKILK